MDTTTNDALLIDPGEIGYDPFDPLLKRDPSEIYRRLRDDDPVHHVSGRDFWMLSRFDDVFHAARDTATFSSAEGLTFEGDEIKKLGLAPTIVMMDPPQHTSFRRLVSRAFTPRHVHALEPVIRAFARERVGRIADAGNADLIAELAGPLPTLVVATYLGVPEHDRDRFDGWSNAIVSANAGGNVLTDAIGAVGDLYAYFTDLIERRRRDPGDDMLSALLEAEVEGERLTVDEILGFCFVMIAGGNDTTTGLLGGAAALLCRFAGERARLIDDPGLLEGAVEEFLRLTSPVQGLSRTTTGPVEVHDTTIPTGAKVHLLYGAANRDPREYGPTAEDLDVSREIPRLVTFGSGPHFCLGAAAARLQSRIALQELLGRLPDFEVDEEAGIYAPGAFVRRFASLPITAGRVLPPT